jgi:hypothetical protein
MIVATVWDAISTILPFVLLFGFWTLIMRNVRKGEVPGQDALLDKLDEIRAELRRLRETIEQLR